MTAALILGGLFVAWFMLARYSLDLALLLPAPLLVCYMLVRLAIGGVA